VRVRDRDLFGTQPRGRGWGIAAAVWGFAEATLFFLVPDVLLSWIALERPKRAFTACALATAGALCGGLATYAWARHDADAARAVMVRLPGIDQALAERVDADLTERGLDAVILGSARGRPYKLFAASWGAREGELFAFLLVSIPARLLRFFAVAAFSAALRRYGLKHWPLGACRALHVALWVAFYVWYWRAMTG